MNLDNDAYVALFILVAIVVVSGGLGWFVVSRLKR